MAANFREPSCFLSTAALDLRVTRHFYGHSTVTATGSASVVQYTQSRTLFVFYCQRNSPDCCMSGDSDKSKLFVAADRISTDLKLYMRIMIAREHLYASALCASNLMWSWSAILLQLRKLWFPAWTVERRPSNSLPSLASIRRLRLSIAVAVLTEIVQIASLGRLWNIIFTQCLFCIFLLIANHSFVILVHTSDWSLCHVQVS